VQTNTHARKQQKHTQKEGKQRNNHKWKHAECDDVEEKAEKSSEAESFKHMKITYPTHLKMAM
jgi:beta-N-acetylglucosaminidase